MSVSNEHATKIQQLVSEGKSIAAVWRNDFSQYEYDDIYETAYEGDERSALGVKRQISNRLNWLEDANKADRRKYISEIKELVDRQYERLKRNQQKLETIREALDS